MGKEILKFGDIYLCKSPIFEKDVDIIMTYYDVLLL